MTHIKAPWTPEQVRSLELWQRESFVHPFTCANRDEGHPHEPEYGDHGVLRPTENGWVCDHCDYTQDWAHHFMLDFHELHEHRWKFNGGNVMCATCGEYKDPGGGRLVLPARIVDGKVEIVGPLAEHVCAAEGCGDTWNDEQARAWMRDIATREGNDG